MLVENTRIGTLQSHIVYGNVSDIALASPGPFSSDTLMPATSLEGGENSPPPSPQSNDPGLLSNSFLRGNMSKHWMWIILIVGALLALWYFYGSSATAAA